MGNSMKTSLIAFIIMIVIILFAGNIPEQISSAEVNITGRRDNIVLAAPGDTPTPILSQLLLPTADQPSPTSPDQRLEPTSDQVDLIPADQAGLTASDQANLIPPDPASLNTSDLASINTSDQESRITSVQESASTSEQEPRTNFGQTIRNAITQALRIKTDDTIQAISYRGIRSISGKLSHPASINQIIYTPGVMRALPPPPPPAPEIHFTDDEGRSWSDYAGPSIWPDMQAYAPAGILSHPEDQINILLLGSDKRPNDGGFRTDTIQLLTINPSTGTVKLTSFPRDLYVNIPGYTVQRINTAFGWGGFDALADTMEYNFGVRPEYYVLINFDAFMDGINSLGGVMVDVGRDFCDHRDAFGQFCVSQGDYWMNGKTALWYVRSRYSTSDLDRGRRQQEVLEGVFSQLISINGLSRIPELYDIYKKNVETNIDLNLITDLLPVALKLADSREINNYSIGRGQVYDWINYSGAMVLVPVRESVLEVMREVVSEP
jgi:LCP family protein required for cell wall assembly